MKDVTNLIPYITQKYKNDRDSLQTARHALNKLLQTKYSLTIDDIPQSYDVYDALSDASVCIEANNFSAAAIVLSEFVENNGPLF